MLRVSPAETTICNVIAFNKESKNVSKDQHKSFIFIEKKNPIEGPKGENGTKGEKSDIVQINQTEINQLKHKISG